MRYSLRTLLILMLLVGPLCIWGWPKIEAWRNERARAAKEAWLIKQSHQRIAFLELQCRNLGGAGAPALAGSESPFELFRIECELKEEIRRIQMNAINAAKFNATYSQLRQTQSLLLFEGSAQELREHLGQPAPEPSQP